MRTRTLSAALTTALTILSPALATSANAGQPASRRIVVEFEDAAGVRGTVLRDAEVHLNRIFRAAGVETVPMDIVPNGVYSGPLPQAPPADLKLLVMVVAGPISDRLSADGSVLALTPFNPGQRGRVSYVFYDRVQATADEFRTSTALLLGCVIAHEIGHMLLPSGHSPMGIMQARWNPLDFRFAASARLLFLPAQVEQIQARLAHPVPPPVAVEPGSTSR